MYKIKGLKFKYMLSWPIKLLYGHTTANDDQSAHRGFVYEKVLHSLWYMYHWMVSIIKVWGWLVTSLDNIVPLHYSIIISRILCNASFWFRPPPFIKSSQLLRQGYTMQLCCYNSATNRTVCHWRYLLHATIFVARNMLPGIDQLSIPRNF